MRWPRSRDPGCRAQRVSKARKSGSASHSASRRSSGDANCPVTTKPAPDSGQVRLRRRGDARIEAHHPTGPSIAAKRGRSAGIQRQTSPSTLTSISSGTGRRPARAGSRSVGIGSSPTREPAQFGQGRLADPQRARAHPPGVVASWKTTTSPSAVSRTSHSMPAPSSIAAAKAAQAVFGNAGAVQAAMREPGRAGVERIRL